jgi:hypothetical protein
LDIAKIGEQLPAIGVTAASLTLVFLGFLFASWDTYEAEEQNTVRPKFLRRGWLAFWGIVAALLSMFFGLAGIALKHTPIGLDWTGLICLGIWSALILTQSVIALLDIKK